MRGVWVKWITGSLLLTTVVPRVFAGTEDQTSMELRLIMQDMSAGMQVITEAIVLEDWSTVAEQAPVIANHPLPSLSERLRILSYFAAESGQFKAYNSETHKAAIALQESAIRRNGAVVIDDFARLQKSCLDCHHEYRKDFVEYFYNGE